MSTTQENEMGMIFNGEEKKYSWTFPLQESQEETYLNSSNEDPSPNSSLFMNRHTVYHVDDEQWDEFQSNGQDSQLSPTITYSSPMEDENSLFTLLHPPHHKQEDDSRLYLGTSLPSFVRKKLTLEEQKLVDMRPMLFRRDYFFAVMDDDESDLDRLASSEQSTSHQIKRVRSYSSISTSEDEESIDSECDLWLDDTQESDIEVQQITQKSKKSSKPTNASGSKSSPSSSSTPTLVHFFGDQVKDKRKQFLSSTIQAPCKTKAGNKAIKPSAFVNKRTTIKQTDKTLILTVQCPNGSLEREDFNVYIVVETSSHGKEISLVDQKKGSEIFLKKLIKDPNEEDLLEIIEEKRLDDGWELSCQITTSNNFGWKSKHDSYKFMVESLLPNVHSCISEPFRVSQNVSIDNILFSPILKVCSKVLQQILQEKVSTSLI